MVRERSFLPWEVLTSPQPQLAAGNWSPQAQTAALAWQPFSPVAPLPSPPPSTFKALQYTPHMKTYNAHL